MKIGGDVILTPRCSRVEDELHGNRRRRHYTTAFSQVYLQNRPVHEQQKPMSVMTSMHNRKRADKEATQRVTRTYTQVTNWVEARVCQSERR
jgi:hypothetical protein